jgi:hypothetical protein
VDADRVLRVILSGRRATQTQSVSNRGGRANEAGSAFRRRVATALAVHGLLGRAVPAFDLGYGTHPTVLEFGTGETTDDLTCRMSTGRSAFISAKRTTGKVCCD